MPKLKFDHATDDFINEFVKSIREGDAAIFAGAGMSVGSGYFDWKKLLAPVAKKMQLDIEEEYDLTALAQFFVDNRGGVRDQLTKILTREFSKAGVQISESHRILARLPIGVYWTTNYDNLIETALREFGKLPDVKVNHAHLTTNVPRRDAIVYKMHGDISDLASTVLTKHEYEDYNLSRELFSNAFKSDFVSRTMLFIGFSFTDPNLDYLISRIRSIQKGNVKTDYYFIKKDKNKKGSHKQLIRARSLERYGLYPVWINDYSDIGKILLEIERRFLRGTIFISGSAHDYGKGFTELQAKLFIQNLAKELAKKGYRIVTGSGLGVGGYVINGVLSAMAEMGNRRLDTFVSLRPFPLFAKDERESKKQKDEYRNTILKEAGVAIFVFGNKLESSEISIADGVIQEFEIAHSLGLKVIPIGKTGFAAEILHRRVLDNYQNYYQENSRIKSLLKKMGNESDFELLIEHVLKAVDILNES